MQKAGWARALPHMQAQNKAGSPEGTRRRAWRKGLCIGIKGVHLLAPDHLPWPEGFSCRWSQGVKHRLAMGMSSTACSKMPRTTPERHLGSALLLQLFSSRPSAVLPPNVGTGSN